MPTEPNTADAAPPVPSVWRLGWFLFMQPLTLHRMEHAWGFCTPSLIKLWQGARKGDLAARALMTRYGRMLLVVMPLAVALAASALTLAGVSIQSYGVLIGISVGVALGVAVGLTVELAIVTMLSMSVNVTASVALVVAFDIMFEEVFTTALALTASVLGGVAINAIKTDSTPFRLALPQMAYSVGIGVALFGEHGAGFVVALIIACSVAFFRLPLWLMETVVMQLLVWRMQQRPDAARQLAFWLPFRHDDLICLPLPGLRAYLIQVAEVDPMLAKELIAHAAGSLGQRRIASRTLIELQARDLERAARGRLFARVAGLDLPFLPGEADLESNPASTPFLAFQRAARDLIAGSTNQRQRGKALERARKAIEDFRIATAGASRPDPLARRLLPVAALWLDVIREESNKLAREVAERPEVPPVFIAGPPLTPEHSEARTLFKGRADIVKLIEHDLAPDRHGVLLVVGQRRMGKTSLCNWLPMYLGTGTTVVASNFQSLSGDPHRETPHQRVLVDIAARLNGSPEPPESARWGDGLRWLEEIDRACTDRKLLVVLDEVERVEDGIRAGWCSTDFLDFLRAAGDALRNIRFLLLTAYPLHRLGPHWTDHLVSVTPRTIAYLDEKDARELITRPIPEFPDIYPEGGVDLILEQTGRHPFLLQKAGDDLCRLLNSRGGLRTATREEIIEVFDGMIRDIPFFDEIWRSRTDDERSSPRGSPDSTSQETATPRRSNSSAKPTWSVAATRWPSSCPCSGSGSA